MKWNMGSTDRAIRLAFATVLVILIYNEAITGFLASVAVVAVGLLFITSVVGFCPVYFPFRISTRKKYNKRTSSQSKEIS